MELFERLFSDADTGGTMAPAPSWMSPEGLQAVSGFVAAMAWPLLVGVVVYSYRQQLTAFMNGVREVEFWGVKAKIETELNKAAEQAAPKLSSRPSEDESSRAAKVAELVKQDIALVRQQAGLLAIEYDNIRGATPPGDERTRNMEKVLSKMRTIGRAAYAVRYELAASPSPGHRLLAVASLQMLPDYEMLDWLAGCVQEEKPFIQYHALIALRVAAGRKGARIYLGEIEAAYNAISSQKFAPGGDRANALTRLQQQVDSLRNCVTIKQI